MFLHNRTQLVYLLVCYRFPPPQFHVYVQVIYSVHVSTLIMLECFGIDCLTVLNRLVKKLQEFKLNFQSLGMKLFVWVIGDFCFILVLP